VIKLGDRYYCCHQAVWYVADTPTGPWQVADKVPDEIYAIPPSNQHYNTTYVHVYDATPECVHGVYPGYVNSYVYGGCVVYGTGWYYPPYISPYYYHPWYPTWGMGVRLEPVGRLGVGVSWGAGPFTITVGVSGFYHTVDGTATGAGTARRLLPAVLRRLPARPAYRPATARPATAPAHRRWRPTHNLYASQQNRARNAVAPRDKSAQVADRVARGGANNVYADRDGNVYRRNGDGSWQQRDRGGWSGAETAAGRVQDRSSGRRASSATSRRGRTAGARAERTGLWGGGRGFSGGGRRR